MLKLFHIALSFDRYNDDNNIQTVPKCHEVFHSMFVNFNGFFDDIVCDENAE